MSCVVVQGRVLMKDPGLVHTLMQAIVRGFEGGASLGRRRVRAARYMANPIRMVAFVW